MKSTAALALALGLAYGFLPGASFALGLEQKGQPQASVSSLPTYGLDVPTRTALKTVIPSGWQLFVHQSAKLPSSVSWKVDDTWPQVLGNMAASSNLSVLVDWDSRTVLIRTPDVAVQEQATRAEIAQAATTPLPRFDAPAKREPAAPTAASAAPQPEPAAVVKYDVKTAPVAPAQATAPAKAPVVVASAPVPDVVKPAVAPAGSSSSAGAPVVMPTLIAPTQPSQVAPAVTSASLVPSTPASSATPAAAPKAPIVVASAPVAASAPAVAAPMTTLAAPVAPVTPIAAAPMPAHVPSATPAESAPQPAPLAPRAVSILEAFASAEPAPAATVQAPAPAPVAAVAPAKTAAVKPAAKPAKPEVLKPPAYVPPAVLAGAEAPVSQRLALSRQAEKTPGAGLTPNADRMAREATLRAQTSTPNPFNDVMPELPEGVFAPEGRPMAAANAPAKLAVVRTNPTASMVAAQEAGAARNPAKLVSTDKFTYTAPTAWNKPSVRSVAQGIANKYGYRLVWAAPEVQLRGPVTMLANSAQEDLFLLRKALGPSHLEMQLDVANKALNVTTSDRSYVHAAEILTTREPAHANGGSSEFAPNGRSPVPQGRLVLTVGVNEPLENAVLRFARSQGYTAEWKVPGGFEAARHMEFDGDSVAQVLAKVLPSLGVSADVYTRDKHIVVRPGEARD